MEYSTCITIPTPDVEFYGRPVGDMVRKGARIQANGIVKGKFPYVTDYISINEKTEGHYFPAWVNIPGQKLEIVRCKDGTSAVGTMGEEPGDNFIVILMDDNKEFDIKVDGRKIFHLDFSEAILEEKREEKSMNVDFFDTGVCGIPITGHVGTLNKDSGTEDIVFDKVLPEGCRIVNVVIVPSDDVGESVTLSVGTGSNSEAFVKAESLTAGKIVVKDAGYAALAGKKIAAKLGKAPEAGTVDVFVTIIRLEV